MLSPVWGVKPKRQQQQQQQQRPQPAEQKSPVLPLGVLPWTALLTFRLGKKEMLMVALIRLTESLLLWSNEVTDREVLNINYKVPQRHDVAVFTRHLHPYMCI